MNNKVKLGDGVEMVLTQAEHGYAPVFEKFRSAKTVRIASYNVDMDMLSKLKDVPLDATVQVITNIPKRWDKYFGESFREKARKAIAEYQSILDPAKFDADFSAYFNFSNHSKIVATDEIAYVGSSNFSAASSDSYECGVLITNRDLVAKIIDGLFEPLRGASIPHLGSHAEEAVNLRLATEALREKLHQTVSAIWHDQDGHSLTGEGYRKYTPPSNSLIEDVEGVLYELQDLQSEGSPNADVKAALGRIDAKKIERSIVLLGDRCALGRFLRYNEDAVAMGIIERNPEAYDENLDAIAEGAAQSAFNERESLCEDAVQFANELELLVAEIDKNLSTLIGELDRLTLAGEEIDNT